MYVYVGFLEPCNLIPVFHIIQPDGGLIVVKTKTFILVATYKAGMYPSVCVEAVEKLGKTKACTCVPACWHLTNQLCPCKKLQKSI